MIDRLVDTGVRTDVACRVLGVSRQGYYRYKRRPLSPTQLRRQWLTGLIREVHVASRGTYGYRRVHAELTIGMKVQVSSRLVSVLMTQAGIYGLPGPARVKRLKGVATADDLVNRKFHRLQPNELWVTDITEHPRRARARSTAPLSSTPSAAASWAGRSTAVRTRPWSSMPSTWPSGTVAQNRAASCTPTTEFKADSIGRRNTSITEVSHDGKWGLE